MRRYTEDVYNDEDVIVSINCPKCQKHCRPIEVFEKGEVLELECGHKFVMKKLITKLVIEEVKQK